MPRSFLVKQQEKIGEKQADHDNTIPLASQGNQLVKYYFALSYTTQPSQLTMVVCLIKGHFTLTN